MFECSFSKQYGQLKLQAKVGLIVNINLLFSFRFNKFRYFTLLISSLSLSTITFSLRNCFSSSLSVKDKSSSFILFNNS